MRKVLLLLVVVLVCGAIAAPFLVPIDRLIPEISSIASQKLGQPVSISDLKLHVLPTPRAVAYGITVGKRQQLRIGELEVVPDLATLFSTPWTIRLVRAENVELDEAALVLLFAIAHSGAPDPYEVKRVQLHDVKLRSPSLVLPPVDIDARLGERYRVERARLDLGEGSLEFVLQPRSATATLVNVSGQVYGGSVDAHMRIDWTRQWQVSGDLSLGGVDLAPLQRLLAKPVKLTGRVKSTTALSARAKTAEGLLDALAIDGPFEILGGEYQGVDLAKAGDLTASRGTADATRFDEFKGLLQMRGKLVRITELCVRSPNMVAGGNIEIAEDQKLSGALSVSVAGTGGFVGVPVKLSGTVAEPGVSPTTGYTIGAVIGTLILPGIGTGIGASAASAMQGVATCR
jgi:uncharacterized protein involved in outer membrane biogenesis